MSEYRKKPVTVEARRLHSSNADVLAAWCGGEVSVDPPGVLIKTLEGVMTADVGDYIIRGVKGEFYPCKPNIFEATYERVAAPETR